MHLLQKPEWWPPSQWCRTRKSASPRSVFRRKWQSLQCKSPKQAEQGNLTTHTRENLTFLQSPSWPCHLLLITWYSECVCVTWQHQGDATCADPPVLGAISEGAKAEHHPSEAAQHRQKHEGPCGIPESCTQEGNTYSHSVLLAQAFLWNTNILSCIYVMLCLHWFVCICSHYRSSVNLTSL